MRWFRIVNKNALQETFENKRYQEHEANKSASISLLVPWNQWAYQIPMLHFRARKFNVFIAERMNVGIVEHIAHDGINVMHLEFVSCKWLWLDGVCDSSER